MKRLILALVLATLTVAARAELLIKVTEGRVDAVPIAIVPFDGDNQAPEQVSAIVEADLHRSGQFKPLPAKNMLSRPHTKDAIIYRDFRVLGQEYLVIGHTKPRDDGRYEVTYGLYDVGRQRELFSESYSPTKAQLRDVAHAISDRIYEELTGIPGAFSTKILYVTHNRGAKLPYQLQYADADGHRVKTILSSAEPIMSPSWSPDGSKIAYVSFENNGKPNIYVHDLASGQRSVVSRERGINGAPSWSPDGQRLVITLSKDGNPELYMVNVNGGGLTRLTDNYGIDTEARWMPDGEHVVFTSSRSGGPQIYMLNINDRSARRVSFEGNYNARPDVTPDGRYLVYVHRRNGSFNVGVQDLQRGTFDIVTQTNMDESPSVAPNGSMVIYGTQRRGTGVLEAVSIDGRVKVELPSKEGEVREPAWSPFL
ncbi:tolB protein precursor, periplasmic protein involved in the tonb-independent uptake of group A colicins [Alloalcanivorax xenomutans]|jgi:TolB protein|uniref:Tol-Pal system beta propeller repeat protein TolB n=1 Tax=Alloalcanivorax xenomutans TaxID=1094342 RepID=UPI0006D5BD4C|nr:Tol-Pal system beta propeller repeat protein TolB [Alloalcanivorax xenomutans]PHS59266.1 MAG: Tol-Pal system beta propeller repeat protein TolB [Alcanivorax sp.]CUR47010.1 tolB protein precursor, periplasmic protein involved in the tonb-independent uptake of group A colicins [Alloalcanivorax xenomutans]